MLLHLALTPPVCSCWLFHRLGATCRHLRTTVRDFIASRALKPHPLTTFISFARRVSQVPGFAAQQSVMHQLVSGAPPDSGFFIRFEDRVVSPAGSGDDSAAGTGSDAGISGDDSDDSSDAGSDAAAGSISGDDSDAGSSISGDDSDATDAGISDDSDDSSDMSGYYTAGEEQHALQLQQWVPAAVDGRRLSARIQGDLIIGFDSSTLPARHRHLLIFTPLLPDAEQAALDAAREDAESDFRSEFFDTLVPFPRSWVINYLFQTRAFPGPDLAPAICGEVAAFVRSLRDQFPPGTFDSLFCLPGLPPPLYPPVDDFSVEVAVQTAVRSYLIAAGLARAV